MAKQLKTGVCAECGGTRLIRDSETGELACQSCGVVVSSTLFDTGPEWRAFDPAQRESLPRVGAPLTLMIHDSGLSTNIGWQNRDAMGRKLDPEMMSKIYRLRKWQRRSKVSDSVDRNLSYALGEMTKISSRLNLPKNVVETSSMNYRKALKASLVRGRTIQSVAVACIYLACRQCGVIRTLEDVAVSVGISKKEAARNYRFLLRSLKPSVSQVNPRGYVSKIVSNLRLSGETERLAVRILDQASVMKLTGGRGPSGMAAACVYISTRFTQDMRTQGDIAHEAQVTEVTIRNRYKELVECMDFEVQV
ncbi:transcription initiation factor IIB [Candidatus Bathyarchaeota archaeon]|nr:MAG: transcription initiation factor IIB [Candidatus Bathyarchaeota archaeon]